MVISIYGNLDNWPETAHMVALLGIHPDTWLVRITVPDYCGALIICESQDILIQWQKLRPFMF